MSLLRDAEVDVVRRSLEGWKEVLVLAKSLFDWDQHFYPWIIFAIVTVKFFMWWYIDPTFFAALSLHLLLLSLGDAALPLLAPKIFPLDQWSAAQENNFQVVCETMVDFKNDSKAFVAGIFKIKSDRPRMYLVLAVVVLLFTAWIGSTFGDHFTLYLVVLGFALYPGAKKHGIVDAYISGIVAKVKDMILKKSN